MRVSVAAIVCICFSVTVAGAGDDAQDRERLAQIRARVLSSVDLEVRLNALEDLAGLSAAERVAVDKRRSDTEGQRVKLELENVPIEEAFADLAVFGQRTVLIGPGPFGEVSFQCDERPWREALDQLATVCACRVLESPDGVIWIVSGRHETFKPTMAVQVATYPHPVVRRYERLLLEAKTPEAIEYFTSRLREFRINPGILRRLSPGTDAK